jgi:hypothetical protein
MKALAYVGYEDFHRGLRLRSVARRESRCDYGEEDNKKKRKKENGLEE